MIHSIMKLGEYKRYKSESTDPLEKYLQDPIGRKGGYIVFIVLEKNNNRWDFSKIEVEDFDSKKIVQLLFRAGGPRGTNVTPTARVTEVEKTFTIKITNWFKSFLKDQSIEEIKKDQLLFIENVHKAIEKNNSVILDKLLTVFNDINTTKTPTVLTLKFIQNGEILFLGDIPIFRNIIEKQATEGYRFVQTFIEPSFQQDQVCSICGFNREEVFGYFSYFLANLK